MLFSCIILVAIYFTEEIDYEVLPANRQMLKEASDNAKVFSPGKPFIAIALKK